MREKGSKAKLSNISFVNFKEVLRNAGKENARGIGISQVIPYPYSTLVPVAREFQTLMKEYQPEKVVSYASMESFIAAKILVDTIRRTGADPTRQKITTQLEKMNIYDVGGFGVSF